MDENNKGTYYFFNAVLLEGSHRYVEAYAAYQDGIQTYKHLMKDLPYNKRICELLAIYQKQADSLEEKLRLEVTKLGKLDTTKHRMIKIREDDDGFGYEKVFADCFQSDFHIVRIEEPYLRKPGQFRNLLRFCALLMAKCKTLHKIILLTLHPDKDNPQDNGQSEFLNKCRKNLSSHKIDFEVKFLTTKQLHDRKISFSNGWVVVSGRGLDYFKKLDAFDLGNYNLDLAPCKATHISIYMEKNLVIE